MAMAFLRCEKCSAEIEVPPLETQQVRAVTCPKCRADLTFVNTDLKVRETPPPGNAA